MSGIAPGLDAAGCCCGTRRDPADSVDGMPPGDGGYLPATFWLAQSAAAVGRGAQARQVFTRLLELRNDVGLLAEGYDPLRRRFAGNHPLAQRAHRADQHGPRAEHGLTGACSPGLGDAWRLQARRG